MPRLTRMQKYADKRDQLANDKEEKVVSNDLSSYQDRLNNVENTLSFSQNEVKEETHDINPEYTWKPFEGDSFSQSVEPIKVWEDITPIQEEVKAEEPVQEEVKTTIEAPVFEEAKVEEPKQETNSFFEQFMSQPVEESKPQEDFNSYFETLNDDNSKGVFKDVTDDSGEIVSQKERDTYLNQTMSDVFSYNINNGEQTINTVIDNVVDEVRHGEEKSEPVEDTESIEVIENPVQEEEKVDPIDNTYWTPFVDTNAELDADKIEEEPKQEIDDEEFSNTVSMEISKMMEEIAKAPETPEVKEEPVIEEVKQEEVQETIQINETITEEKPEEVVEIKNISEIDNEPAKDTMSSTIPFIVAAEDEEIEEEEEEDGSNTVLNVILIVLIVVLVAVLGLIVFYILKTKGIF